MARPAARTDRPGHPVRPGPTLTGRRLRPLRWAVVVIVVALSALAHPGFGLRGRSLGVTLAVIVFVAAVAVIPTARLRAARPAVQLVHLGCLGAVGVAVAALEPNAVGVVPAGVALLLAGLHFEPRTAATAAVPVTLGVALAVGLTGGDTQSVVSTVLLCAVLVALGTLVRQATGAQARTEVLLAELEAARDDQAAAAAAAERTRIARDLHDVLAHSLSGLTIQLEGARALAAATGAAPELREVLDRSAGLAREGLVEARSAVGALRADDLLDVGRLPELAEHFRRDLGLPVDLEVEGRERPLPTEVSATLYRVAGEALTNVVRHAPGARTRLLVAWEPAAVRLRVSDDGGRPAAAPPAPVGWGLTGIAERVARVGGASRTGPDGTGWTVEVTVPAP